MKIPNVRFLICNFNKRELVQRAVRSAYGSKGIHADVHVLDNASSDGSFEEICRVFSNVTASKSPINTGGAGGFARLQQQTIEDGYSGYVCLLDNDAWVEESTIAALIRIMSEDATIGVASPCILQEAYPERVQEAGSFVDENFHLRLHNFDLDYSSIPKEILSVDYTPACCMIFHSSLLKEVGVFDESFFLYWDDIEWCSRIRKLGKRIICAPHLKALHRGNIGSNSPIGRYYYLRNRFAYIERNLSPNSCYEIGSDGLFRFLGRDLDMISRCTRTGRQDVVAAYGTALGNFLSNEFGVAPRTITTLKPSISNPSIPLPTVSDGALNVNLRLRAEGDLHYSPTERYTNLANLVLRNCKALGLSKIRVWNVEEADTQTFLQHFNRGIEVSTKQDRVKMPTCLNIYEDFDYIPICSPLHVDRYFNTRLLNSEAGTTHMRSTTMSEIYSDMIKLQTRLAQIYS